MTITILATATDIAQWADKRSAQGDFPRLLRRLIISSTDNLLSISIRADEGIQLKGSDGVLSVGKGNEFVPEGDSVWEFGTNKRVKPKADSDYESRKKSINKAKKKSTNNNVSTTKLGEINPCETTYVFVTPRRWRDKEDWVEERKKEKFWKDVRVHDADDLETWLESSKSVHVWLSILIGKHPENAIDLENHWLDWINVTKPEMSPDLVISGRDKQSNKIKDWLEQTQPSSLTLKAKSKSESIAFFAATVCQMSDKNREKFFSNCLIVNDIAAWKHLSVSDVPLILIPKFDYKSLSPLNTDNGHQIFIPLGKADATGKSIELPRLNRAVAEKALLNMGVSEKKASKLATLVRRSFPAFIRKLAINPEIQTPEWSKPSEARSILPIILAGEFVDSIEKHREAISRIARVDYEAVNNILVRWLNEPDAPFLHVNNVWMTASREDSWLLLSRYLTNHDLNRFKSVAVDILSEIDQQCDLPPDDRWIANIESIPYSYLLKKGIAETLAIIGARSELLKWEDSLTGQGRANQIVSELLNQANENWKLWASLSGVLPLLAEAAPEIFLDAVEEGLKGKNPILLSVFSEGKNPTTLSFPHVGLLWALETVAWHPDYLPQSAMLLAKLARLDPGSHRGNNPAGSLRGIFLPWYPYTMASLEQRLSVIDTMRKNEPEVAWELQISLLPMQHDVNLPAATPCWREWRTDEDRVESNAEYGKAIVELVSRLLKDAGIKGKKWLSLIDNIFQLPEDEQELILDSLSNLDFGKMHEHDKLLIRNGLRETISRHREYPTEDWSMPPELTNKLEKIYEKLTPDNIIAENSWLFSNSPGILNPSPYIKNESANREVNDDIIASLRLKAVTSIFRKCGVSSLLELAKQAEHPLNVGFSLGKSNLIKDNEDAFLSSYLACKNESITMLVTGYVQAQFQRINGLDWVKAKLFSDVTKLSPSQKSDFLAFLPFNGEVWDIVDSLGGETKRLYWEKVNGFPKPEDAERACRELLASNRPQATVKFLAPLERINKSTVSGTLIVEVLRKLVPVINKGEISFQHLGYNITLLFKLLDKSNEVSNEEVADLELSYLPGLVNRERGVKQLWRQLACNPEFFVEVASIAFRAQSKIKQKDEHDELTENTRIIVDLSRKLLESWQNCPGKQDDGSFDERYFREWVIQARHLFEKRGLVEVGDKLIGEMFTYAPYDDDGTFPHLAVRDLIEKFASKTLERSLEFKISNNRGATGRVLAEGGGQDRAIAEQYLGYAKTAGAKHHRTAAMLRKIATNYTSEAKRGDLKAELEQNLWR